MSTIDPRSTPGTDLGKDGANAELEQLAVSLADLQERLFAEGRMGGDRRLLLVLQGMDTSGKGGAVKAVPGAGLIGVFDRSHYEDVLIVRVRDLVPPSEWQTR